MEATTVPNQASIASPVSAAAQPAPPRATKTFAIQFHITDACDQRCKHCYIFAEGEPCELPSMSLEHMRNVCEQARDLAASYGAAPYFYITGGDPLLHPQFWDLARDLHAHGDLWAVMGNPFHVTPQVAARLKALGCRKYQVSLDGLEATHDAFRKPGSYAATLESLATLKAAGIWTAVMTTVSSANAQELPALIDVVAKHQVDVYAFARYCPTSPAQAPRFHMEPRAYRELLLAAQERFAAHEAAGCPTTFSKKDHLWTLLEYEQGTFVLPGAGAGCACASAPEKPLIYDGCHCGCSHLTVTPNGDVYACRRMESCVGNAFEHTLKELFESAAMEAHRDFDAYEKCARCELFSWCRGCPAVAAGYTGNQYAPDPQCWKEVV
jgi:radical SAM/SPASM domain protein of ACGX system